MHHLRKLQPQPVQQRVPTAHLSGSSTGWLWKHLPITATHTAKSLPIPGQTFLVHFYFILFFACVFGFFSFNILINQYYHI